jgi:hypothetical protein
MKMVLWLGYKRHSDDDKYEHVQMVPQARLSPIHAPCIERCCSACDAGASLAVPSASDTMGAVAANAGSTPLHLAAMKVRAGCFDGVWQRRVASFHSESLQL